MANYKQHLCGGTAVGIAGAAYALSQPAIGIGPATLALVLGPVGGMLPDIDCDTSTPVQIIFGYLGVVIPVLLVNTFFPEGTSVEQLLIFTVLGYFFIHQIVSRIFFKLTTHRGIFHSVPAVIICGEMVYLLFRDSLPATRLFFAIVCSSGYLVHLIMDEIWSVDLMGARFKKSFGTALKFTDPSKFRTFCAYAIVFILLIIILLV